jgi:hypothetical protein
MRIVRGGGQQEQQGGEGQWVVVVLGEVVPPDPEMHVKLRGLLEGGEFDFSKLPTWVRRFELRVGALERCLAFAGGVLPSYCRDGFAVVFEDNNQIVGVVRRFTTIVGGGYRFVYEGYAKLPRFMGILRHGGGDVLFIIRDGAVDSAWELKKLTPFMIVHVLSRNLREPFWCLRSKYLAVLLFNAITRVRLRSLRRSERTELVGQLRGVGVRI